jgi:hypothetical protein
LNPVRLVLDEVALEFDKVCAKIKVIPSITHILKQNESLVLPKAAWGGDNLIDSFFPFDPYLLRGSSKYFKGAYQFWQSSPEEEEEEESLSHSESRDRSPRRRRRNSDFAMSTSYDDNYGSFSTSMEMSNSWSKHATGPLASLSTVGSMELDDEDGMGVGFGTSMGAGMGLGASTGFLEASLGFKGSAGLYSF